MNKVGIYGFGCVGQGLYDVLSGANNDVGVTISKICVQDKNKPRKIDISNFTFDEWEILNKNEATVIVELINSAEDAFAIVSKALQQGKKVVTSNKKLIGNYFNELYELQKKHNTSLLYEAAACGSIPIIRTLEEYYDNEELKSIRGIFNGTSNYILSKIYLEGWSYEKSLKDAQDNGFAELNPTADVEGYDAKYKVAILSAHAFGTFVNPEKLVNIGISNVSSYDFQYAREKGLKIKLVAHGINENGKLYQYVLPHFVGAENPLFNVENEFNGVLVEGKYSGKQFFYGKGAGSYPTGSAVLSDISALNYDYKYSYKKINLASKPVFSNDREIQVYLRFEKEELLKTLDVKEIIQRFESKDYKYIIGKVNLQNLLKASLNQRKDCFICEI